MNKITRKSFLKVLAATMVGGAAASALTGAAAPVSIDETNGKVSRWVKNNLNPDGPLTIAKQGMFSSGGTVTAPVAGTYDATTNWLDTTRAGNTAHVDHANVLYQMTAVRGGYPAHAGLSIPVQATPLMWITLMFCIKSRQTATVGRWFICTAMDSPAWAG